MRKRIEIADPKSEISNLKSQILKLQSPISNLRFQIGLPILCALILSGCASPSAEDPPTTRRATTSTESQPEYSIIAKTLGHTGILHDNVFTVTIPRADLMVSIEGMDVPAAAGIASVFNFYRCSCGKSVVIGQVVCADYEANDVLLALQENDILVSSVSSYLIYEKPRLLCIRFQSEGDGQKQAAALKSALSWTAKHTEPPRKTGD